MGERDSFRPTTVSRLCNVDTAAIFNGAAFLHEVVCSDRWGWSTWTCFGF